MPATNLNGTNASALPRVVIVDPGYDHVHAHHHWVNNGIRTFAATVHVRTLVIASADLRLSEVNLDRTEILPYFTTPTYPKNADALDEVDHARLVESFRKEVVELFEHGAITHNDRLYFHTFYSFHLIGLERALTSTRFRGTLLLSMMFSPGQRWDPKSESLEVLDQRERHRYQRALKALCSLNCVTLRASTSCEGYRRGYQELVPQLPIDIHPRNLDRGSDYKKKRNEDPPVVCLYLGGPKVDKGLIFASKVCEQAVRSFPNVEFVFQLNLNFPGGEQFFGIAKLLRSIATLAPNLLLIERGIDENEMNNIVSRTSVACILYDPSAYKNKTSGIFWDFLHNSSIQWVVSGGTWIQDELEIMNITHETVQFGDVSSAILSLSRSLDVILKGENAIGRRNDPYYTKILSPYPEWVLGSLGLRRSNHILREELNKPRAAASKRILVVRTKYPHLGRSSGPAGFIPELQRRGHVVDTIEVPLGHDTISSGVEREIYWALLQKLWTHSKSFQGCSIPIETLISSSLGNYDFIHFLDGEHTGLLTASVARFVPVNRRASTIVTFHQPPSEMEKIFTRREWLNYFDRTHILGPNQHPFLTAAGVDDVVTIPHGVDSFWKQPDSTMGLTGINSRELRSALSKWRDRHLLLSVGSWLRDYGLVLQTADLLSTRADIGFLIVGRDLPVEIGDRLNVILITGGISDQELRYLYNRSFALFLPVIDAVANNAVLEAMSAGLPIITTENRAIDYYTGGLAVSVSRSSYAASTAILGALDTFARPQARDQLSLKLKSRAAVFDWREIAREMDENLYTK
jgi:glycosyltransferase involved in cell wall biosynthesis